MKNTLRIISVPVMLAVALSACQTKPQLVLSEKTALELRSIQSRVYETPEESKVFRAIISVMQDLGYAITSIEPEAGVISGNKLAQLDLTATVNEKDAETTVVRANAIVLVNPQLAPHQVDSAEFYQQRFFDPLSQALFLDALYDVDPSLLAAESAQLKGDDTPK